ncbi:hypothetical protein I3843_03G018600 [Carya illinoinensis]|uniref:Uncharacterized protein n=1 Tax=Carya illinoinensis TaxID=32201 RepID=A0A8T1QYT6_CARIL|nr:hypothetical protein CIPAW_03G022100 [Carya illinoinensis]KAG6719650.1 hypothetical protein I3842_03G016700 [Carya illinoinensis]KAG7985304.1 hypothetical protein I3843_03G018600 [Carya illinoinensis]
MKAIILICILFASLLILSPAITARELGESGSGNRPRDPNTKASAICGKPADNPAYSKCIAKQKPKPTKCTRYDRGHCKPAT